MQSADAGTYTCEARNSAGVAREDADLDVSGRVSADTGSERGGGRCFAWGDNGGHLNSRMIVFTKYAVRIELSPFIY